MVRNLLLALMLLSSPVWAQGLTSRDNTFEAMGPASWTVEYPDDSSLVFENAADKICSMMVMTVAEKLPNPSQRKSRLADLLDRSSRFGIALKKVSIAKKADFKGSALYRYRISGVASEGVPVEGMVLYIAAGQKRHYVITGLYRKSDRATAAAIEKAAERFKPLK